MIFIFFLMNIFFSNSFSEEKANYIIGGSFDKVGSRSEFISGAIAMVDRVVDSHIPLYPKAIFYRNNGDYSLDKVSTRNLVFKERVDSLFGFSIKEGIIESYSIAKEKMIPFIFPQISFRKEELKDLNIYTIRPSIEEDLEVLSNFVNGYKGKVMIVVDSENSWQAEYVKSLVDNEDIDISIYIKDPLNINSAVLTAFRSSPELIVVLGEHDGALSFLKRLSFSKLAAVPKVIPFYLTNSDTMNHLKRYKNEVYAVRILPSLDSNKEIVKDYIRDSKKYMPAESIGESGLEGYISMYITMLRASKIAAKGSINIFNEKSKKDEAAMIKEDLELLMEGAEEISSNKELIKSITDVEDDYINLDEILPFHKVIDQVRDSLIDIRVDSYVSLK